MKKFFKKFLYQKKINEGFFLIAFAVLAIFFANSKLKNTYRFINEFSFFIKNNSTFLLKDFVNDFLMSLFFFLIGIEIKYEIKNGSLRKFKQTLLPIFCALGGVLFPFMMYYFCNFYSSFFLKGCAIPTATDIAFVISILSFLKNVPNSLRIFLLSIAIIDDIIAIFIIAIFYGKEFQYIYFFLSIFSIFMLLVYKKNLFLYLIFSIVLWIFIFFSGIHATIAGVLSGILFSIPEKRKIMNSSFLKTKRKIEKFSKFFILPIFAFCNSGIDLQNFKITTIHSTVFLGIFLGLSFGKPIGITFFAWIFKKAKVVSFPKNITIKEIFSISVLCGIGFTMSIFLTNLSFYEKEEIVHISKFGIFFSGIFSSIFGYCILKRIFNENK
ncbi:Na+/H+ antiporter NhaA [bacterium endosymbiont of Pedicinus badii]|uniref:Na+/H+ antiporter NhaA n=1 Tax=bacterium endosymbiont of Pedicinus badii TaxID=1719126 RepID=UPI0009B941FD|nr:Na+/H+ antiporter NhaA [bacterium endosymbiont of Pedicinus badii]OQM34199.1 hypothetical protein AOQ89_02600 [bacterium endosymbiont of Pedicinus badii]